MTSPSRCLDDAVAVLTSWNLYSYEDCLRDLNVTTTPSASTNTSMTLWVFTLDREDHICTSTACVIGLRHVATSVTTDCIVSTTSPSSINNDSAIYIVRNSDLQQLYTTCSTRSQTPKPLEPMAPATGPLRPNDHPGDTRSMLMVAVVAGAVVLLVVGFAYRAMAGNRHKDKTRRRCWIQLPILNCC